MAFEYNVKTSKDLRAEQDENCEAYFDIEHEFPSGDKLQYLTRIKTEPESPNCYWQHTETVEYEMDVEIKLEADTPTGLHQRRPLRPSLSTSDLHALVGDARLYTSSVTSCSTQTLNGEAEKRRYVTTAEGIYHFQRDTPERFHSQAKCNNKWLARIDNVSINYNNQGPRCTVAKSPMLLTKTRRRPVRVLSRQELEEKELEEIKNYTIKANPVPQYLKSGKSVGPSVAPPPITKVVPFNLTEVKKKPIAAPPSPKPVFVAKPAPKHILEKPFKLKESAFNPTVPVTPKITKSRSADNVHKIAANGRSASARSNSSSINGNAPPVQPFSFCKRDEELRRKHEEKIRRMIEDETRIQRFKANPVPAAVRRSTKSSSSSSDRKENRCEEGSARSEFKPKPPTVLYKSPFVPKLSGKRTEPVPFKLTAAERSYERGLFDQQIRQKEEENERIRRKMDEERLQKENEEVKLLREQLVHKPNPIRCYHQFVLQPSNHMVTVPQSPNITKCKHKIGSGHGNI